MKFQSFMNKRVKKMDWVDIAMIKWSCIAFGVLLVILFPVILDVNMYYFVAITVVLAVRPLYNFYLKK